MFARTSLLVAGSYTKGVQRLKVRALLPRGVWPMNDRFTPESNFDQRALSREARAFTLKLLSCAFAWNESRFEMLVVEPIGSASDQRNAHDSADDDGGEGDRQPGGSLVGHGLVSLTLVGAPSLAPACAFCVQSHGSTQFRVGYHVS